VVDDGLINVGCIFTIEISMCCHLVSSPLLNVTVNFVEIMSSSLKSLPRAHNFGKGFMDCARERVGSI
jgi:hypothetical protein